jgi:hypothetical protein
MINRVLSVLALGLVLGALLVMFTPWMRDFSRWTIDTGGLALGVTLVFAICFLAVSPPRRALWTAALVIVIGAAIDIIVLSLPAALNLVPNATAFTNYAQNITAFTCLTAGPFVMLGSVSGILLRVAFRRRL